MRKIISLNIRPLYICMVSYLETVSYYAIIFSSFLGLQVTFSGLVDKESARELLPANGLHIYIYIYLYMHIYSIMYLYCIY